jgi:hypothetical protein
MTYQQPRHSTEGNLALTLVGALAGGNALGITSKQIAVPTQVKFARLQILQVPSFDAVQIFTKQCNMLNNQNSRPNSYASPHQSIDRMMVNGHDSASVALQFRGKSDLHTPKTSSS